MRMEVNRNNKIVELWLTNKEKNETGCPGSLKPLFQRYKEQQYLVAVFFQERRSYTSRLGTYCSTIGDSRRSVRSRRSAGQGRQ